MQVESRLRLHRGLVHAASVRPYGEDVTNDDIKAKMREALEKKQDAKHSSAEGAEGSEKVHGPEVHGSGKRVHRRKSG